MSTQDIINVISADRQMMDILRTAQKLNLPNWMIGAGFVRNKIWDHLHGFKKDTLSASDIDLIYFDTTNSNESADIELSRKMQHETGLGWEIVNQTYTHSWHHRPPYANVEEALADWVEVPTCVAVSLTESGEIKLHAPHGIADLVNLIVRKNPYSLESNDVYRDRVTRKKWKEKWPKLEIIF